MSTRDSPKALAAFIARKGDVGTLENYASLLKRITGSAFGEGEHADG